MGLIAWLFYLQPKVLQRLWGRSVGGGLRALGMRRPVVEQNLKLAFPQESEAFRQQIVREAYNHLGYLIFEILLLLGPMRRFIANHCRLVGFENWQAAKARGKGVIFVASHVGNWEIMAASGAVLHSIDIMIVTKKLKPAWLHRAIESGRSKVGVQATYEPRTLKDVLRHLSKNGTVGFVMDQYSGPPVGVRVPVFGIPVGTPSAIAMLAKRTGATVLSVVNYRTEKGDFVTEIRSPLAWTECEDPRLEVAENTARFAAVLEKDIYAHPGQWLWTHRRFKGDLGPLRPGEWLEGRSRS
jgi:KDO2-lipid IV(A) lauroyltransferase